MRAIIIVLVFLFLVAAIFGWLLDAQAGAAAVTEFLSEWSEKFVEAE